MLTEIVRYCDELTRAGSIKDFEGAFNGLQVANSGRVSRIGACVDAGKIPFERAARERIDFLIVHHGLFWSPQRRLIGSHYAALKQLFDHDCALYSSHLPLDAHPEIGNNASILRQLELDYLDGFLEYEGTSIGIIASRLSSRDDLRTKLKNHYGQRIHCLEFGPKEINRIGISSGSGSSCLQEVARNNLDAFITGELKQHNFNEAQELGLNVYACGHYATEVHGVRNLAQKVAQQFGLEWTFIDTECPL